MTRNVGVGIITNNIPLWSLYNYTIVAPKNPFLIIKAPFFIAQIEAHTESQARIARRQRQRRERFTVGR